MGQIRNVYHLVGCIEKNIHLFCDIPAKVAGLNVGTSDKSKEDILQNNCPLIFNGSKITKSRRDWETALTGGDFKNMTILMPICSDITHDFKMDPFAIKDIIGETSVGCEH